LAELPALGERGGGWVVLQFALIGALLVAGLLGPRWPGTVSDLLSAAGAVLAVAGGLLAVAAARRLGSHLSPYPRPKGEPHVVESGPYRVVRHPIYAAGVLFFAGFSLVFSPAALVLTVLLLVVWSLKLRVEERFLLQAAPAYAGYAERTPHRLVPFVY
jgi:protein-S-isoprenylcysteine O-methyltransferase Ste14